MKKQIIIIFSISFMLLLAVNYITEYNSDSGITYVHSIQELKELNERYKTVEVLVNKGNTKIVRIEK